MKPIKLTGGYAYANTDRNEVLICTVDDDGPSHAYTLTADDLTALLAALVDAAGMLPVPRPARPRIASEQVMSAMEAVLARFDMLSFASGQGARIREEDRANIQAVRDWWERHVLTDDAAQPQPLPWALTPEQWAALDEKWVCAAVDKDGERCVYEDRPHYSEFSELDNWTNRYGLWEHFDTVALPDGVDWRDTLTWRPGHEPKDGNA